MLKKIPIILILIPVLLIDTHAQKLGEFRTPLEGDTILSGEFFVVFELNPNLDLIPSHTKIYLDEIDDLTPLMRVDSNYIAILFLGNLKPGTHKITIYGTSYSGRDMENNCFITVISKYVKKKDLANNPSDTIRQKKWAANLDLDYSSRMGRISGPGSYLRQAPEENHYVCFQSNVTYKSAEFPIKINITNHEDPMAQARNRYLVGIKFKPVGIMLGDVNPVYDRYILNGNPIRGFESYLKFGEYTFQYVQGNIRRKIEGGMGLYDYFSGLPPYNLQSDSSYILPGTYRRKCQAINIARSTLSGNKKIHVTFLKSTDDSTSIKFGGAVSQNIVAGFGSDLKSKSGKFLLSYSLAISATTYDIRSGTLSQDEFKENYGTDPGIDPGVYKKLIVINATTAPLTAKNAAFLAFFIHNSFQIKNQQFNFKYQRIGNSFYSFGNPYLINDRKIFNASDKIKFLKNKAQIRADYNFQTNNLSKLQPKTQLTNNIGGNLMYNPGSKLPSLFGVYRITNRRYFLEENDSTLKKVQINNYSMGVNYNFVTGIFTHSLSLQYIGFLNNIKEIEKSNNKSQTINFNIYETLANGLNISIGYNSSTMVNDTVDLYINNTYSLRLGYKPKDKKLFANISGSINLLEKTDFTSAAQHKVFNLNIGYQVSPNLILQSTLGITHYNENENNNRKYDESWGKISLKYQLKK